MFKVLAKQWRLYLDVYSSSGGVIMAKRIFIAFAKED